MINMTNTASKPTESPSAVSENHADESRTVVVGLDRQIYITLLVILIVAAVFGHVAGGYVSRYLTGV